MTMMMAKAVSSGCQQKSSSTQKRSMDVVEFADNDSYELEEKQKKIRFFVVQPKYKSRH